VSALEVIGVIALTLGILLMAWWVAGWWIE